MRKINIGENYAGRISLTRKSFWRSVNVIKTIKAKIALKLASFGLSCLSKFNLSLISQYERNDSFPRARFVITVPSANFAWKENAVVNRIYY